MRIAMALVPAVVLAVALLLVLIKTAAVVRLVLVLLLHALVLITFSVGAGGMEDGAGACTSAAADDEGWR